MISFKTLLLASGLVCMVSSAPQYNPYAAPRAYYPGAPSPYGGVPILAQHYDLNPDGSYTFGYRSGDGSGRDETGTVRGVGPEGPIIGVQGQYTYNSPEGPVQVQYVADENGFQPNGPGVHPAIVQAVAQQVAEARANPGGYYPGSGAPARSPAYYPGQYRRF